MEALFLLISLFSTVSSSPYYTAAVYEHVRFGDLFAHSPEVIIQNNLDTYDKVAKQASEEGADILVFPECGIFPTGGTRKIVRPFLETVPNPQNGSWNPCEQHHIFLDKPILTRLSCMAKNNHIVIAANMGDMQPCTKHTDPYCPDDGVYQYNTDVVLDRDGTLLARYYKIHLYFEPEYDVPRIHYYPFISTDFGNFTMFTCFDIVFYDAVKAVEELKVNNVIYPTYWFDLYPNYVSVQVQQSFAITNNVNLLAANIHYPQSGTLGSGIYSGQMGAVNYTYNTKGPKLLIAKLPRTLETSASENSFETNRNFPMPEIISRSLNINSYKSRSEDFSNHTLIKLNKTADTISACNNGMCCSLKYSSNILEEYFLVVFNGTFDTKGVYSWCTEMCLVVRCNSTKDKKCSSFPNESQTIFDHLELTANFTTKYVYPTVASTSRKLTPISDWNFKNIVGKASISTTKKDEPTLLVSLFGRCYNRDPTH